MQPKTHHPGQRLREIQFREGTLTVTEAARRLGVTRQALNNVLNGKAGISPKMALKIPKVYDITPEQLQQWQTEYELNRARSAHSKSARVRGEWLLVSSKDLTDWAATSVDARYTLPHLVHMLVRNASDQICTADFPAREASQDPGWDGLVSNPTKNEFVPGGQSAWELSTEANPQAKAERDYQKRKRDPLGLTRAETTIVFVSLRRWAHRKQWSAAKNAEAIWKKVIAYDASDIEQWLELNPEISVWLATRLGKIPAGVGSLESFWDEYRSSTSPHTTAELLLAGRAEENKRIMDWLRAGTGVFRLCADSPDEAVAFLAAGMATDADASDALQSTVVVENVEHVRHLISAPRQVTFVWQLDDPTLLGTVLDHRHRAIVPLGRGALGAEHAEVQLQRSTRIAFVEALKSTFDNKRNSPDDRERKESEDRAEKEANARATRSGRSITVYRRLYPAGGLAKLPHWAASSEASNLIPALLAGAWSESNPADQATISALSGQTYADLGKFLVRLKNQPDSPVRRVGDTWTLLALLDAWLCLSKLIDDSTITKFRASVLEVLGERDPKLDLDPDKRWMANVYQTEFTQSSALRKGLAESLIFLSVFADKTRSSERPLAETASHIVMELIGKNAGRDRWTSLSDVLPLLAEAAPDTFLRAVRDDLDQTNPDILSLFNPEDRPLGGGGRHPSLLWALEILAWFPDHLAVVARILAKLARVAPPGKLANRPDATLKAIFCNWHPNTAASLKERLQVLEILLEREFDEAWKLLLALLPQHDMASDSAQPRWREKPERSAVTNAELWCANSEVLRRVIDAAGTDPARLRQLIRRTTNWPVEERSRFLDNLRYFAETSQDTQERTSTWKELRDFIALEKLRSTLDDDLKPFREIQHLLEPDDFAEQYGWLFNSHFPYLDDPETKTSAERTDDVEAKRREVTSSVLENHGVSGLLTLARQSECPWLVGAAAAEVEPALPHTEFLEKTLGEADAKLRNAGIAFVGRSTFAKGQDWAENILQSESFAGWADEKKADFCLGLPFSAKTWEIVAKLGEFVQDTYWRHVHAFLGNLRSEEAEFVIERLLDVGRLGGAMDQAGAHPEKLTPQTLAAVLYAVILELAGKKKPFEAGPMFGYYVERIFQRVRESGELSDEELGKLEWQYLPVFRFSEKPAVTLHKLLKSNPDFFSELVRYSSKADNEEVQEKQNDEMSRSRAHAAWDLLSGWNTPPGLNDDRSVDRGALRDWFESARSACISTGRTRAGDHWIGQILANLPNDPDDGLWPHRIVRDLIETAESTALEAGLRAGRFNGRGVWTKAPSDAGDPERNLAKSYRNAARELRTRWTRTAEVLTGLAETYDMMGRHSDALAEELDLL